MFLTNDLVAIIVIWLIITFDIILIRKKVIFSKNTINKGCMIKWKETAVIKTPVPGECAITHLLSSTFTLKQFQNMTK